MSQEALTLPQQPKTIETFEEFKKADAKLEAFVDQIEAISPNKKIDIFDPEFWEKYTSYMEEIYDTKVAPDLGERVHPMGAGADAYARFDAYAQRLEKLVRNAVGGEQETFNTGEHTMRLKIRTLMSQLESRGDISPEAMGLLRTGLPSFYTTEAQYLPKKVNPSVLKEAIVRQKESLTLLLSHPDKEKIELEIERFQTMHQLLHAVEMFIMSNGKRGRNLEGFKIDPFLKDKLSKIEVPDDEIQRVIEAGRTSFLGWSDSNKVRTLVGDGMSYTYIIPIEKQIALYQEQLEAFEKL